MKIKAEINKKHSFKSVEASEIELCPMELAKILNEFDWGVAVSRQIKFVVKDPFNQHSLTLEPWVSTQDIQLFNGAFVGKQYRKPKGGK